MCLIVHVPANAALPGWIIRSAMNFNEDGVGVLSHENGANVVRKWVDIRPHKLERKLAKLKGIEHAIHFRMATHGRIAESNVHPFPTVDGGQFMHNGVLGKYTPVDRKGELSDSRIFIRDWLNPMLISNDEKFEDKLRQEIAGNAVLLCAPTGEIKRYGSGWVEHDGCYFSNEYAWAAPYSPTAQWYDTLTGYSGDQSYTPGKYLATYNANYAVAPSGFNAAYADAD